jgi:hypothetical protein
MTDSAAEKDDHHGDLSSNDLSRSFEPMPLIIIWNAQRPDMMMRVMMDSTVINSQVSLDIASADL